MIDTHLSWLFVYVKNVFYQFHHNSIFNFYTKVLKVYIILPFSSSTIATPALAPILDAPAFIISIASS